MRGQLWTVAGGVYASKPRPALVIESDYFPPHTDSLTVLPLTTTPVDAPLLRVVLSPQKSNGLTRNSWVMIDKITTIRKTNLGQHLGDIDTETLLHIERLLLVYLGIG